MQEIGVRPPYVCQEPCDTTMLMLVIGVVMMKMAVVEETMICNLLPTSNSSKAAAIEVRGTLCNQVGNLANSVCSKIIIVFIANQSQITAETIK